MSLLWIRISQRSPDGEGSETWDRWEMRIHKRRIEVDEPLVDPHLPAVPRLAPLPVGGLPHRHDEPFRRERNRARHRDAGALADQLDLLAHVVDLLRVGAAERDAGLLGHGSTWRRETEGHGVSASRRR